MKRLVPGLADTARDSRPEVPDGIFLVRVDRAQFRWHAHKPFYVLRLSVLEPRSLAGQPIVGLLYCTQKAMWKLGWFLRDFLDPGRRHRPPDRVRAVPAAQRHPLSPESLYHLPLPRTLSRPARVDRGRSGTKTGSRSWSV